MPPPPDENVERAVQVGDPDLLNNAQSPVSNPQFPDILITHPALGEPIARGLLSIRGTVNPPGFQQYVVEYGEGDNPSEWKWISGPHLAPVVDGQLTEWGIESLPAGALHHPRHGEHGERPARRLCALRRGAIAAAFAGLFFLARSGPRTFGCDCLRHSAPDAVAHPRPALYKQPALV
ncbi:MAG: hypothetical protein KatS3mg052_2310 [Candidatus Roseilinea sp.]|nr:MAG: hypothetical protein KatS3mg052_2310 [Candidatus Roseilinea sp.]